MKKTGLFVFLLLITSMVATSQQPGSIRDANAKTRQLDDFQSIDIGGGVDLVLTQGNETAVAVSASNAEYRDRIITKVDKGVLRIYYENNAGLTIGWRNRKLRAYVSVKQLNMLHASGGSDVIIKGKLQANQLKLRLSGGSDLLGELEVQELTVEQTGGSDAHLKGNVANIRIKISSGSDFGGYDLSADYAIIEASGGSDARLTIRKEIYAEASSGSDIDYKGSPSIRRSSASGGSSISRH